MSLRQLQADIQKLTDLPRAKFLQRFFKTGRGGYAENDKFLGLRVPEQRVLAKKHKDLTLSEIQKLLDSKYHEHRLIALFILVGQFTKGSEQQREKIYKLYLKNTRNVNNWDLVDTSAGYIVGGYLKDKSKAPIYKLAKSKNLWERRIAMIATFHFIYDHKFDDAIRVAKILLNDKHDLIHKAVGWMLREIGKRDEKTLTKFLDQHSKIMPRTALRYSIERLTPKQKKFYMAK